MTEQGIVGPHKGSKSREILLTLEQWEEMHGPAPSGAASRSVPTEEEGDG
jgi:hypothetical protein